MDIIPSTSPKSLISDKTFSNYILIVYAYSKTPKLYGMEKITTEEVMDKLDIFQSKSVKIEESLWWSLERISTDSGKQFTSTEFKEECQTCGVHLRLGAPEHQETKIHVKVTRRTLCTIAHSLMVHARVLEAHIYFALM